MKQFAIAAWLALAVLAILLVSATFLSPATLRSVADDVDASSARSEALGRGGR